MSNRSRNRRFASRWSVERCFSTRSLTRVCSRCRVMRSSGRGSSTTRASDRWCSATNPTLDNAKEIKALWLNELNSPLRQREWKPMRGALVVYHDDLPSLLALVTVLWWRARREKARARLDRSMQHAGYAFILPWIIGFIALTARADDRFAAPELHKLERHAADERGADRRDRELSPAVPPRSEVLSIAEGDSVLRAAGRARSAQITALAVAMLMNVSVRGHRGLSHDLSSSRP